MYNFFLDKFNRLKLKLKSILSESYFLILQLPFERYPVTTPKSMFITRMFTDDIKPLNPDLEIRPTKSSLSLAWEKLTLNSLQKGIVLNMCPSCSKISNSLFKEHKKTLSWDCLYAPLNSVKWLRLGSNRRSDQSTPESMAIILKPKR